MKVTELRNALKKRGMSVKDFNSSFVNFTKVELMQHLSLYLMHAISPSPQIELKFKTQEEDPVNDSNSCQRSFGTRGVTRHKEFKAYFTVCNPIFSTRSTSSHPNWKIDPYLKNMMKVSKDYVSIGQAISIDQQDISFQGRYEDEQRIPYKKAGDVFLVDALCSEGYTLSWYFKNQVAPKSWIDKCLFPLHARVLSLFQQLPEGTSNYKCGMDNLFMSPKLAKFALHESGKRVMIHGVCRVGQEIPQRIIQDVKTKKEDLLQARGTVKASVLTGDPSCTNLVAASLCDTKPVYLLSNACDKIEWTKKD